MSDAAAHQEQLLHHLYFTNKINDYSIKYKNFKMYFISECTLFRNRIKYIFKSLHFGNLINSGIKWVTRIPKAVIRKKG